MINKLNKLGYTKIELLVVIILIGLVAFITINKNSYAFELDNNKASAEIKKLIEIQAKEYANNNIELFKETNITYISVNDLVDSGYLIGNNNNLITDPTNPDKSYNAHKIKLEYSENNNMIEATFID